MRYHEAARVGFRAVRRLAWRSTLLIMSILLMVIPLVVSLTQLVIAQESIKSQDLDDAAKERLLEAITQLPVSFEPNWGLSEQRFSFLARGAAYSYFLAPNLIYVVPSELDDPDAVLHVRLLGADMHSLIAGEDQRQNYSNYLIGSNRSKWQASVPRFGRVRYAKIYPRIDLIVAPEQNRLKFQFILAPFAGSGQVKLRFEGAQQLKVNNKGDLLLNVGDYSFAVKQASAFQEIDGRRSAIKAKFIRSGRSEIRFALAAYKQHLPLTINLELSSSSQEEINRQLAMTRDSRGNVYFIGTTSLIGIPQRINSIGTGSMILDGNKHPFILKLDKTGSNLIYSTIVGGHSNDIGQAIAVDEEENVYLTGITASTSYPVTAGAAQMVYGGGESDIFVTKLHQTGSKLIYSTYIGGSGAEFSNAVTLDAQHNACLNGETSSTNFPVPAGSSVPLAQNGTFRPFQVKVNSTGTRLLF